MVRKLSLLGGAVIAAALIASVGATSAHAATHPPRATFAPVPSLTPAATQKLWRKLVQRAGVRRLSTAACAPLRAVFYSPTDWRRLTTKLAATSSPCAQYYVSVPPLAADKTQLRADEAWRIRALGPAFHAMAEINVTGWTSWVAANGKTWYEAGAEARRRMASAGYDVGAGDTWALNELSSAVRQGTGNARANMRAFLNGLYDGEGSPPARGVVFIAGIGQNTVDLSLYQARLQDWYEDAAFWNDMTRFASDWSQELYGDVRHYAVGGLSRESRRDALIEYLQHQTSLAGVAPASAAAAGAFLAGAYNPLANAAWQYDSAFGWTNVPADLMQDYVSAQIYAMRAAGNSRFGFAWSPKNLTGMPSADFTAQTDALLVRLAAAIADSAQTPEAACGTAWCDRALDGAALNGSWGTFAAWKPSRLALTTPAQTLVPSAPSAPISVELQTATGGAYATGLPVAVALTSSSPTGEFSVDAGGPWATTLATSIATAATTTSFYFRDSNSGSVTITATAASKTAGTQTAIITAQPAPPPPQPVPEPPPPAPSPPGSGGDPPPDVSVEANAAPANPPTDTPPSNDVAGVTITVAAPVAPAPAQDPAPTVRAVGTAPVKVTRRGQVATVSFRFSVSEAARLEGRLTALRSRKPLALLPLTSLAGKRSAKLLPVATAAVRRAGTYTFAARVPAAKLVRGRTYVLHVSAVDSAGRERALTISVRA